MRIMLAATLTMSLALPAVSAEKLRVWVQADPDQPYNTQLEDSANDIREKLKSKTLALAADAESSDVTMTVVRRWYAPTGDYFVNVNEIDNSATVKEGGKATVQVMLTGPVLGDEVRFFSGQTWNNSWTGAANNARKNAEKFLKGISEE